VAAGSLFAILQSAAAAPLITVFVGGASAAGGIVVTFAAKYLRHR